MNFNEIQKRIDIANCLCVQQMYLNKFCTPDEISVEKLKNTTRGHWGCVSAINFVYANISKNTFFNNASFVLGTGHGGSALVVNAYLDNQLKISDKNYSKTNEGLDFLISSFGEANGLRSESSAFINNINYCGGELGYALAFSYGEVMNNPQKITFCFIGDGECETGTTASSWILNTVLRNEKNGLVIPIINLNKFKMGGKSLFSNLSPAQLTNYFSAFNFKPIFVENNKQMQTALKYVESCFENNNKIVPLIILNFQKGQTAPVTEKVNFVATSQAHKDPLSNLNQEDKIEYLKEWLKCYNINKKEILNFKGGIFNTFQPNALKSIDISLLNNLNIKEEYYSSATMFSDCFNEITKNNKITLFSPDELISNKFNKEFLKNIDYFEVLNENICQALMQGMIMQNNYCACYCYEGFMPIISSMLAQYLKQLYEIKLSSNKILPSLNYFLTSVCWENCYSHQNPEIYSTLTAKTFDNVNCLFPLDANSLKECFIKTMQSHNQVNIVAFSKRNLKQYLTAKQSQQLIKQKYIVLNQDKNAEYVLFAMGDTMAEYMQLKKEQLNKKNINVKCVYVYDLKILENQQIIKNIIGNCKRVDFYCHGYASLVERFLYKINKDIKVYGYADKSYLTATAQGKVQVNFN